MLCNSTCRVISRLLKLRCRRFVSLLSHIPHIPRHVKGLLRTGRCCQRRHRCGVCFPLLLRPEARRARRCRLECPAPGPGEEHGESCRLSAVWCVGLLFLKSPVPVSQITGPRLKSPVPGSNHRSLTLSRLPRSRQRSRNPPRPRLHLRQAHSEPLMGELPIFPSTTSRLTRYQVAEHFTAESLATKGGDRKRSKFVEDEAGRFSSCALPTQR